MAFKITNVKATFFPSEEAVASALNTFGLPAERFGEALDGFVCSAPVVASRGYQQDLAAGLEAHLGSVAFGNGITVSWDRTYSEALNERADVTFASNGHKQRVFVEIEFRPNVEKDLVNFQIGHNAGRLAAAILILACDRNEINAAYTTMPEFWKFVGVIRELRPGYPLMVCGIGGEHMTGAP